MSIKLFINIVAVVLFLTVNASAQTSAFVYQGKLNDGNLPANGTYQFEFKLYDSAAVNTGNQVGSTLSNVTATVTNGIFSVNLDFGADSFDGNARFLEIGVRLNGTGQSYTMLSPRQPVTSTPYSVKSLKANQANTANLANNATNLGGIAAAQYVQTNDSRMSDARTPLPNSTYYVQNGTSPQAASNFNVSGEGRANIFSATTQFNIGANRVLHTTGTDNIFVGVDAGKVTTGGFNAFFGSQAGKSNTAGLNNSFFGAYSGSANTTGNNNAFFGASAGITTKQGSSNSFFGSNAGFSNFSGSDNSFFGNLSGFNNSTGTNNSFFGRSAGENVISSGNNSFFGAYAGQQNTNGSDNVFMGANAGKQNTTGKDNIYIGSNAGSGNTANNSNVYVGAFTSGNGNKNTFIGANAHGIGNLENATAIGAGAVVQSSNTIVIGTSNTKVKIPGEFEQVKFGAGIEVTGSVIANNVSAINNIGAKSISANQIVAMDHFLSSNGAVMQGETLIAKLRVPGNFNGPFDTDFLCREEDTGFVVVCFASRAEMKDITNFQNGLNTIKNLRPVAFNSGESGKQSVGLMLEDASAVNPLFVSRNSNGEVKNVKYMQVITALVSAVQEQQEQIKQDQEKNRRQEEIVKQQQKMIEDLRSLVCAGNPKAAVCQTLKTAP